MILASIVSPAVVIISLLSQILHAEPHSPPHYPSPWMAADGPWKDAYDKAAHFVSQLSLLEKVNLTTGVGIGGGRCLGTIGPIPRLGFRGLCLQDTPNIADFADYASAFPSGINVGATWDRTFAYKRGAALGKEFRLKGADILLRPSVGPLGRFPEGGRNWEGFSPDPYLSGELVAPTVEGIQDNGVVATTKHYLANEQEHFRLVSEAESAGFNITESVSMTVDDRTMHEIYLWPFANAVKAGTGAFMCSYNQIDNSYGCQNSYTLNFLLKNELNFQGFVMSDWGAHHSGVSSALAGLDMSMPGDIEPLSGLSYWGANLTIAVANGTLPEWRLDDMCMRIMAAYYKVGREDIHVPVNFDTFTTDTYGPIHIYPPGSPIELVNEDVYVRANHKKIIREIGTASAVLLKNNGALPLTGHERQVGLFGNDAGSNPLGANGCPLRGCNNGTLAAGWGSGAFLYPYLVTPEQAISNHVITTSIGSVSTITDNYADEAIAVLASQVAVAIVFVNANSGEGLVIFDDNYGDRNNLTLWGDGDALIKKTTRLCNNTIVVMHTVGPVLVSEWHDNENVTAILWAGLPGQESGNSLVDVLYGQHNPSGKLPFTFGATRESYGSEVLYKPNRGRDAPQKNISGLDIDYRHFDANGLEPIYEFGFGLSYTTFEYSDLQVTMVGAAPYEPVGGRTHKAPTFGNGASQNYSEYLFPSKDEFTQYSGYIYPYLSSKNPKKASMDPDYGLPADQYLPPGYDDSSAQPVLPAGGGEGGNPGLWDPVVNVSARITNTGQVDGHEVAQVYVDLGGDEPPKVLRGFDRMFIPAGASRAFNVSLVRRDLSTWDTAKQNWVTVDRATIYVGSSSRKLPLSQEVALY